MWFQSWYCMLEYKKKNIKRIHLHGLQTSDLKVDFKLEMFTSPTFTRTNKEVNLQVGCIFSLIN